MRIRCSFRARTVAVLAVVVSAFPVSAQLTWVQRAPAASPPALDRVAMAFDTSRNLTMLFVSAQAPQGLWAWDGNAWTQQPIGSGPASYPCAMAYDANRKVTIVGSPYGLYEWDGTSWKGNPANLARGGYYALAYQPDRKTTMVCGGYTPNQGHVFFAREFDASTTRDINGGGAGRSALAMAYDAARRRMVVFGGFDGVFALGDTWESDGSTWTQRFPATVPSARYGHAMACDPDRRRVVMFGGYNGVDLNDLWEWEGTNWYRIATTNGPSVRQGHALVYDTLRKRMVLFGGLSGFTPINDTWELYDAAAASFNTFGVGCSGSAGTPALAAAPGQVPRVGGNFIVNLNRLPAGASTFVYLGLSKTSWGPFALPLDLGFIGMPSCTAYTSGNLIYSTPNLTGSATWTMSLGNDPGLLGLRFYLQGMVVDAPANALGVTVSNAGEGVIGS